MNEINNLTITANSRQVATIPSDIFLTYLKIKELMESRIHSIHSETTDSMSLEDKEVNALFLAGQLKYLNEKYEKQLQKLPNSSSAKAPQKKARVITPEPADFIDFDDPESLQKFFH